MPSPYYQDDWVTIYHGDCRDILPELSADLVLTDPPYGIDGTRATGLSAKRGKGNYTGAFTDDREYIKSVVVPVIEQCMVIARCVVVTPGNRNVDLYPQAQSFGAFYQPAAVGLQTFGNLDAQPILYYGRNASKPNGKVMGVPCSYRLTEIPEPSEHPCPKPLRAWRTLLCNVSLPGQVVIDPFVGSGTTLRAAKDTGRKSIGIELEERYCELAALRMAQEVLDFGEAA